MTLRGFAIIYKQYAVVLCQFVLWITPIATEFIFYVAEYKVDAALLLYIAYNLFSQGFIFDVSNIRRGTTIVMQ